MSEIHHSFKNSGMKLGNGLSNGVSVPPQGLNGGSRRRLWSVIEKIGLAVLLVVIWMLLLIPVIFYHLPVEVKVSG